VEQTLPAIAPERPRSHGRLILLTLLVVFPFLALLVTEQGRVIDSQRLLIQQLVGDSLELNQMKARDLKNRALEAPPAAPQSRSNQQPGEASKPKARERNQAAPNAPAPARPAQRPRVDMKNLRAV
jgi:hypothetical protein